MKILLKLVYNICSIFNRGFYKLIIMPIKKSMLAKCGKKVYIGKKSIITYKNVYIGNHVAIGMESLLMSSDAKIIIGNNVMFGPKVTIITGDHRIDILGKSMIDVHEKLDENDKDVIIESDVWIGSNVTILKGVTVGEGSVIASGSIVTKNIPPYTVAGGVPAKAIRKRFSEEQIKEHKLYLPGFRKKVLMVIPNLGTGGAEKLVIDIARNMDREKFDVTILSLFPKNESIYNNIVEDEEIKVVYMNKKLGISLSQVFKVTRYIVDLKPDIIHTHLNVAPYTLLGCMFAKVKCRIHTVHNMASTESTKRDRRIMKLAYKIFNFTPVGISDYIKNTIMDYYKLREKKVPCIYNGIDTIFFNPNRYKVEKSENKFYLVNTGSFKHAKNHKLMIDAFYKVCNYNDNFKVPYNIYLKLVGDGYLRNEIEEQIKKYHLEDRIILVGEVKDVCYELNNSDVLLMTSDYEGLPLAVLEAMACGLPIITTKAGGVVDVVEDGQNSILVDVGNKEQIIDAIIKLEQNKALVKSMGVKSRELSLKYDIRDTTKQYEDLYIKILNKNN